MNNDPKILREARRLAKTQSRASGQPYSKHLDEIARQAGHGTWSSYVRAQRSGNSDHLTLQQIANRFSIDVDLLEDAFFEWGLLRSDRAFPTISGHLHAGAMLSKTPGAGSPSRSEEHTSELQSLMRTSYAVFCLKKKNIK